MKLYSEFGGRYHCWICNCMNFYVGAFGIAECEKCGNEIEIVDYWRDE